MAQADVTAAELSLFELKEKAKWSRDNQEKKLAITGMLSHGATALQSLEEVFAVSAYEDIKEACVEAIKSIRAEGYPRTPMDLQLSQEAVSAPLEIHTGENNTAAKKKQSEQEAGLVASEKLADLPP